MMPARTVRLLDENTANKIAAGEVVERPASIVKELVENALDAGSTVIEIEIAAGGTELIRVTDNGSGMTTDNARLAILRHATSKISSAEDLNHLVSLGFRGEALPSIAAVSRFTLLTRPQEESIGTRIEIEGGVVQDVVEAGAASGTSVTIRDLFFNTPARRKFLKTVATEGAQIHSIIGKIALSYPGVTFKLINHERLVLSTPGTDDLLETAASLYGHKIKPDLLAVDFEYEGIGVTGVVAKPHLIKGTRAWQTFIVNNRVITNRMMGKALDNAYHSLLPKTGFPLAVIRLSIAPETVDVNVHPQKLEIKFSNDQLIYQALYRAVKDVLIHPSTPGLTAAAPSLTPNLAAAAVPLQLENMHVSSRPEAGVTTSVWHPSRAANEGQYTSAEASAAFSVAEARQALAKQEPLQSIEPVLQEGSCCEQVLYPLGQIDHCYIVAQGQDGLYIIDQHAAHERIRYDKLSQAADRVPSQQLLVPLLIEFTEPEADILIDFQGLFYELGFAVELAGPTTIRLLEVPADIQNNHAEAYVRDIISLIQSQDHPTPQALRHSCLQLAACHGAIRAGEKLNMRQIQALLEELCQTELPYTCPHGRPAMIRFTPHDLSKLFKRT
jgi:DNA mismatch repair protein MutL